MTRNHLIGGTDAASLLGLGRVSPTVLYLRLRGEMPDEFEGNAATDAGHLFEDHVAVPMAKKHLGIDLVRPAERVLTLPDEPRIGASLDFEVAGEGSLGEVKLTGSRAMWGQPGERVPLHVAAQAQFQMAVARARGRAVPCVHVIAAFVPGFVMEDFPVEEDRDVGEALLARARHMLHRVDTGTPPEAGSEADARALFLARAGTIALAGADTAALVAALRVEESQKKDCEARIADLRDKILPAMGEATELVDGTTGELLATWRANTVLDVDRFAVEHPDLFGQVAKLTAKVGDLEKVAGKKLLDKYRREPQTPAEAVRVFRLKGRN